MAKKTNHKNRRRELVVQFGGKCQNCGYGRCLRALQFHHEDSSEKDLWSKGRGNAALAEVRAHPERFKLLCANCHFEAHEEIDMAKANIASCPICGAEFQADWWRIRDGKDKYCSRECSTKGKTISFLTPEAIKKRIAKDTVKEGDCWIWQKRLTKWKQPAAITTLDENRVRRMVSVRPLVLFAYFGAAFDQQRKTRMSCGRGDCVNPDHILVYKHPEWVRVGSHQDRAEEKLGVE